MSRPWMPLGVVVAALLLGIVIAGWPDRRHDEPLSVQASQSVQGEQTTTEPPSTASPTTSQAAAASATTTTKASPTAARTPALVRVTVFNASGVPGSATRVSTRLKAQGYTVGPAGPDRRPAQTDTVVQFRIGFEGEAKAVATALGVDPSVTKPADGTLGGLESFDVAVIVGSELANRV